MTDLELHTTRVDLAGLMSVLGEHLYSTPLVAVRELVQNAHDAITRRRIEDAPDVIAGIRVRVDPARGTLRVEDDGAGLTRDEVVSYLATVGAGYTRVLRQRTQRDDLIGYFGLGLLSAFVVSDAVEVRTASYQTPGEGWRYRSRDGQRYTLEAIDAPRVGTTVELTLKERFRPLLSYDELGAVLRRYCALLPAPVHLGDEPVAINDEPPPWRAGETHPLRVAAARRRFAARFERRFEPLCVVPVEPREGSDLQGLLWVQDGGTYGTSDNRNLAVFVRGMLLDDDARELLPAWAGFVGGVVESAALTPTASREDLQRDAGWGRAAAHLADALIDGLAAVATSEPEAWRRVLRRHNEALLGSSLCDARLMRLVGDELTVPTSEGDLQPRALLRRGERRVYVSLGARGGFEEMLFRALKVPIAAGSRYGVLGFLQAWCEAHGGAVVELGTEAGNREVFRPAPVDEGARRWLAEHLGQPGWRLVTARFAPAALPAVVVPDRDAELKARLESDEADKRVGAAALKLARAFTKGLDGSAAADLYVNLDNEAVAAALAAREARPAEAVAALALLRAAAALMSGWQEGGARADVGAALAEVTTAARRIAAG